MVIGFFESVPLSFKDVALFLLLSLGLLALNIRTSEFSLCEKVFLREENLLTPLNKLLALCDNLLALGDNLLVLCDKMLALGNNLTALGDMGAITRRYGIITG